MFKNKNTLKGFLSIATFLVALLILVFMSAPAMYIRNESYTCLQMISGYTYWNMRLADFSFLNLIPYILLVILLVFEYLKYTIKIFDNRVTRICMSVGFVIIGVMLLFSRYMTNTIDTAFEKYAKEIGWGTILQVIVSFICAIFCAIDAIVEFEPEIEEESNEEIKNEIEDLKATYIEEMKKVNNKNDDEQ